MSAWLIASCAKDGGPHPEVPAPDGGAGLGGGAGGAGGSDGGTDAEAGAGGLGGSGGGAAGVGGFAGMSMTGGVGGIGTGGMGTGGMSASESCTDSDATLGSSMDGTFSPAEALEKGTTNGTNGTFEDACDDRGDLIEHTCETHFGCGDGDQRGAGGSGFSTCAPRHQPTGRAIQHLVDCFGMCADGVCEVPCPAPNDPLTVTAADAILEEYELDPGIQGLRYVCSRMCDSPAPSVGDVLTVRSIAAPDDTRLDCRELFSDTANPLLLSDGCSYIGCSARRPSTP